jgi:hypothetical protein
MTDNSGGSSSSAAATPAKDNVNNAENGATAKVEVSMSPGGIMKNDEEVSEEMRNQVI